jgi:glycosyltransferase involved in cell wall biosynthesis
MTILSYHNVKVPHTSAHSILTVQTSLDLSGISDVYYYANRGDANTDFEVVYGTGLAAHPSFHLRTTISSQKGLAGIEKRTRAIKDLLSFRREKTVVYVTQAKPLRFFLGLKKIGFRIKVVVEPHSEAEVWDRDSFANADGIIYTSMALRDRLTTGYSISPDIPNRIFYHRVRSEVPSGLPAGRKDRKDFCLGYIGGLEAWKGGDTIVGALGLLPENVTARFIGGAKGSSDHSRLLSAAIELGLEKRITFTERMAQEAFPLLAGDIDAFVLPLLDSSRGSLPMKMFDYMLIGRPIIAASQESVREILHDESALFYDAGSSESLAGQVLALMGRPDLGAGLANRALHDIQLYSVDGWREDMKAFFREIGAAD